MEGLMETLVRPPGKLFNANLRARSPIQKSSNCMDLPELESVQANNNADVLPNEQVGNSSGVINFLKIYFNFAFYLCCSPFSFKLEQNGWFVLKTFRLQQVICALLHFLAILRLFTEVRRTIPDVLSQTPEEYFSIARSACGLAFKLLAIKQLWWNKRQFLNIMNFIIGERALPKSVLKLFHKYFITAGCILCTIMPLILLSNTVFAIPNASQTWWNRSGLVSDGRFGFFMINRTEYFEMKGSAAKDLGVLSSLDYFAAIIQGLGLFELLFIGYFFDACLLSAVLTLWCLAQALAKDLKENDHSPVWTNLSSTGKCGKVTVKWVDLYKSYKGIRYLSHLINTAFGGMTTAYVAESILYHSMNLDRFVLTKNVLTRMHLLFFVVSSSMTFLFSADVCSQMDTLKFWLAKDDNRRTVPLDELNIVLHELNSGIIGIRGNNIFTISYSTLWNILTCVLTFFLICVQSRGSNRNATQLL